MLLHRYSNIDYILALDSETGSQLIIKAEEQEKDARIFQQWTAQLSTMALSGEIVSYKDYKDYVTGANIDMRPTFEILQELDDIERQFENGGDIIGS